MYSVCEYLKVAYCKYGDNNLGRWTDKKVIKWAMSFIWKASVVFVEDRQTFCENSDIEIFDFSGLLSHKSISA